MSRSLTYKNLTAAIRAPFFKRFNVLKDGATRVDHDMDNGFELTWANPADTLSVGGMSVDSDGALNVGREAVNPQRKAVQYDVAANASIGTTPFFIADRAYTVTGVSYVHKTAGTNGSAVTAYVSHDTGNQAPGAGTSIQSGTFNCKGTTNTVQNGVLSTTAQGPDGVAAALKLNPGERLSIKFSGTLTTLAGVVVTVYLTPAAKGPHAVYYAHVNGDIGTQTFFVANRDHVVQSVQIFYGTAFAAATTIDVTKDTGTTAPGGGTSVLSAAAAGDGTAKTVITPALAASVTTLRMAAGDRLAVKFSATTTGADVLVVVTFAPIYGRKEVTFQLGPNGQQQVAQNFFIADRDYHVVDCSCVFGTAAGGAAKLAVEICKGTTAPGSGTSIQTDNTNAGFDMNATANTVQVATLAVLRNRILMTGDRLSLQPTGAAQSIANTAITVSLEPR